jgi:hypothetical protein
VKKATHEEYQKLNYALINCAFEGGPEKESLEDEDNGTGEI